MIVAMLVEVGGQFLICPKNIADEGIEVPIPTEIDCEELIQNAAAEANVTVYLPVVDPPKFALFRCWEETKKICMTTEWMFIFDKKESEAKINPIQIEECWRRIEAPQDYKLKRITETEWSTEIEISPPYPFGAGENCDDQVNLKFEIGTGMVKDGQIITSWMTYFESELEEEEFTSQHHTYVWNFPGEEYKWTHINMGTFSALKTKEAVAIIELENAFIFATNQTITNTFGVPQEAIKFDGDVFMIIEEMINKSESKMKREINPTQLPRIPMKAVTPRPRAPARTWNKAGELQYTVPLTLQQHNDQRQQRLRQQQRQLQ